MTCNYCRLKIMKEKALQQGNKIVLKSAIGGGIDAFKISKGTKLLLEAIERKR